jgi:rRNA-processing protein FCF1
MKIIVNDTNILIDLANLDLLENMINLPYEFHTIDFVINEIKNPLQLEKIYKIINLGKLKVGITKSNEYSEILKLQTKNLSFQDCSVWYYATKIKGILLTGDANLKKLALNNGLNVKGILFIFDELLQNKIIDKKIAFEKLIILEQKNIRLPKNELEKRKLEYQT